MGNGASNNSGWKPSEDENIPFSEFTFFDFDTIPASEFPGADKSVSNTPFASDAVADVLEGKLANPYREALMKSIGNAKPKGNPSLTPKTAVALKLYPFVLSKLEGAWGSPELFHVYLAKFSIMEERTDPKDSTKILYSREGFPRDAADELATLAENHDRIFGLPGHLKEESHTNDPYGHSNAK